MAAPAFERLTQLDHSFLVYESDTAHMHVASTMIFEAGPLRAPDGSIDIGRIRDYVLSRLDRIPRYRQRIATTPIEGHPVWVDDPSFNIRYHVRHSALPRPGTERQLKRMAGRIFSLPLDREKPLWELWFVEGLEGDRVAMVSKVHHCMVDGISGAELIMALLTSEPCDKVEIPPAWTPRPAPGALRLGVGEVTRALRAPLLAAEGLWRVARDVDHSRHDLLERLGALAHAARRTGAGATAAPFNRPIGPHRRVDWLPMSLERIREIRQAVGGTVNDVVLATAAGGLGRFLSRQRGTDLEALDFRVMAPVSVRAPHEQEALGNRVSAWILSLPLAERDPLARLEAVRATTAELKEAKEALGAELLTQATEWTGGLLLSLASRLVTYGTPFNMVVTNVPGPQVPLWLLESRMVAAHPMVPLVGLLGLGIALFSYAGTLSWGFCADWDLVPDLHELVTATEDAFEELFEAATAAPG